MRILFIYPNLFSQVGFNYGLSSISSLLKREGHKVHLLNVCEEVGFGLDYRRIGDEIERFRPDIVGFSTVTNQYRFAKMIAQFVKDKFNLPTICGGIHPTMSPDEVIESGFFDYVCIGEGELALLQFAKNFDEKKPLYNIKNIWAKVDGEIVKNGLFPFLDLSLLPPHDFELFDFQKMIDVKDGWVGLMTSRGCPFSCSYCLNHKIVEIYSLDLKVPKNKLNYVRFYPKEKVISEIKHIERRYKGIKVFIFDDDIFTMNKDYLKEFLELYKKTTKVPFVCNCHVKMFDEEIAKLLKDAGCIMVKFGVESGSERIRREILNRHMKNSEIEEAFSICKELGLKTSAFVMIGIPKETKEDVYKTIELLCKIRPQRFRWSIFFPYVGTKAYELCKREGLIDKEKFDSLTNFMDGSCLKLEDPLFFDKLRVVFPWYVNMVCGYGGSIYRDLVNMVEKISEKDWKNNMENSLRKIDESVSFLLKSLGKPHYYIKYNRFMALLEELF